MEPDEEIALDIDQASTRDATGTMVMLELEAMEVDHPETDLSAQYVDHNPIREGNKNPDDPPFLRSACRKWGIWFSPAGRIGSTTIGERSIVSVNGTVALVLGLCSSWLIASRPYSKPP